MYFVYRVFCLLLVINCDCWSEILSLLELPEPIFPNTCIFFILRFSSLILLLFIFGLLSFMFSCSCFHSPHGSRAGKENLIMIWNVLIEWQQNRMQWQHPWMYRTCKAWSFTIYDSCHKLVPILRHTSVLNILSDTS